MMKLKAKNPTEISSLEFLLNETFQDINAITVKTEEAHEKLITAQNNLMCVLKLLQNLISLLDLNPKLKEILIAAFSSIVDDLNGQVR